MSNISVNIDADLKNKISQIARKNGFSLDECISFALSEYVENYEDSYKTDLCSVDGLERSFFLSVGE